MTKQQMIEKIYEVIGENDFVREGGFIDVIMYGDACDWIEKNLPEWAGDVTKPARISEVKEWLDIRWKFKRRDITEQPDHCIEYLYSFISK